MKHREIWKSIPGYKGIYDVSNLGRIRRVSFRSQTTLYDVQTMKIMRARGLFFQQIADCFRITKRAVIKAISYRYKREPLRLNTRLLHPPMRHGYPAVSLCKNGISKMIDVHILVALAFIGPRPKGYDVNHKDGNRSNPHVSNLEYITHAENILHYHKNK